MHIPKIRQNTYITLMHFELQNSSNQTVAIMKNIWKLLLKSRFNGFNT